MALLSSPNEICHRTSYEETIRTTTLSVLNTLEGLTAPLSEFQNTKTPKDDTITNRTETTPFATTTTTTTTTTTVSYEDRLASFRTSTYFAKPIELSPIVCARFGWMNDNNRDILRCPDCQKLLCVRIPSNLSNGVVTQTLISTYRQRLATSHSENCSFRSIGETWLLPTNNKKLYEGCRVVPPYLLSLDPEYSLLECCTNPLVVLDKLTKESIRFSNSIRTPLDIPLPPPVKELLTKQYFPNEHTFLTALTQALASNNEPITKDGALLSCFGWRFTSREKGLSVSCPLCQSSTILTGKYKDTRDKEINKPKDVQDNTSKLQDPSTNIEQIDTCDNKDLSIQNSKEENDVVLISNDASDEIIVQPHKRKRIYAVKYHYDDTKSNYYKRPSPSKKRRIMDPKEEAHFWPSDFVLPVSWSADFDLIDSHKHYCPYSCGFSKDVNNSTMDTRPVWKILLTHILDFLQSPATETSITKHQKLNFQLLVEG